ncbi:MAG: gliding motility-associated C-terminal domain-containing protein [Saprospirales bacterium]|nr:gliding motility-associated C-terminal domain-containing protein [Saprospirales bacterium]
MRLVLLFLMIPFLGFSQFYLNGAASKLSGSCYLLTPATLFTGGSIWSPNKINLNESFQAIFKLSLGCTDAGGADGIVFGFQPISTSFGQAGGGLGFQTIAPSLGVEFDTWQNNDFGDPWYDHIAIVRDGDLNHNSSFSNLAGPVQADPNDPNIEDCDFHRVRVDWDAGQQLLQVWFDCELRLSYTGDIVMEIFDGDPWVYWGFTAGTGSAFNVQQVCLDYTTFFQQQPDVHICAGGQVQLEVSGSTSYLWSPAEGLSNPYIPNPVAAPSETTTYLVEMRDDCQLPFYDTTTVFVHEDSLVVELGPDTTFCEGTPFVLDATPLNTTPLPQYFWSASASSSPQLEILQSGSYRVTVSLDANCITEDWITLTRIDLPKVALGPNLTGCTGEPILLQAFGKSIDQYFWNTGEATAFLEVIEPGSYHIAASNECGEARDTIQIDFRPCESELYIPNVFSPNFDGINDRAGVMGQAGVGVVGVFQIYDRWGTLVYEERNTPLSPSPKVGWDGTLGGRPMPPGVYVYFLEVQFINGKIRQKKGDILLVR